MNKHSITIQQEIQIFCENIKNLREAYHLSEKEMSKILGISVERLQSIEKGILPPKLTVRILFRIQVHFHIRPQDMFRKI